MVLFKEDEPELITGTGLDTDLKEANAKLTNIGQELNDSKEQICMPNKSTERICNDLNPGYKGKVGQA
eukprot:16447640-Heterocapsa_arctica.AAC.1